MKPKYVYIHWDTPFKKRKEMETMQDLSLSLKFKDYDFLAERVGLHPTYVKKLLKECDLKFPEYLPLFKKAVKEQLLRDVYIL
jgi:hypothetical protein